MEKKLRKSCKHQSNIKIMIEAQIIIQILLITKANMNFTTITNKTQQTFDKNRCNRHVHHSDQSTSKAHTANQTTTDHHPHVDNYNLCLCQ